MAMPPTSTDADAEQQIRRCHAKAIGRGRVQISHY